MDISCKYCSLYCKITKAHKAIPGFKNIEDKYVQVCWVWKQLVIVFNVYYPLKLYTQMPKEEPKE